MSFCIFPFGYCRPWGDGPILESGSLVEKLWRRDKSILKTLMQVQLKTREAGRRRRIPKGFLVNNLRVSTFHLSMGKTEQLITPFVISYSMSWPTLLSVLQKNPFCNTILLRMFGIIQVFKRLCDLNFLSWPFNQSLPTIIYHNIIYGGNENQRCVIGLQPRSLRASRYHRRRFAQKSSCEVVSFAWCRMANSSLSQIPGSAESWEMVRMGGQKMVA